jgi:curli biogenesis system outer membrane secretion channel CsgG
MATKQHTPLRGVIILKNLCNLLAIMLSIGLLGTIPFPGYAQTEQTGQSNDQTIHRKRLAVVQFEVPDEVSSSWGDGSDAASERLSVMLPDMIITPLVQSGAFDVMGRSELDKTLQEKDLKASDLTDPALIAKNAKLLGVDYILGGKITEFGIKEKTLGLNGWLPDGGNLGLKNSKARVVIDVSLIDVQTGNFILTMQGSSENSEKGVTAEGSNYGDFIGNVDFSSNEWTSSRIGRATRESVQQVVNKILDMFPPQANVRLVLPDGKIILDIGKFSSVVKGDKFEVSHVEQLIDPDTKEVLFNENKLIGLYTITEVQDNTCKAAPVNAHAKETPAKGDIAVLKKRKKK